MVHFKIIIPMYNVEKWISATVKSVKAQSYDNYEVMIIDDMSTDSSYEKTLSLIGGDDRFKLIANQQKRCPLENTVRGIQLCDPKDEDVIVILDGDDWFYSDKTLDIIANRYENTNCLITYGSHIEYPSGNKGNTFMKYPDEVITKSLYRQHPLWLASHTRTFKHLLWKNIKDEDLRDIQGNYYQMTGDLAAMFPMLEMAQERQEYIADIIHVYNRSNPINEDKSDHSLQLSFDKEIRGKTKYPRLETSEA